MAPFNKSEFDDRNWASVRRTLADCDHLNPQKGRLLLGTVTGTENRAGERWISRPQEFGGSMFGGFFWGVPKIGVSLNHPF